MKRPPSIFPRIYRNENKGMVQDKTKRAPAWIYGAVALSRMGALPAVVDAQQAATALPSLVFEEVTVVDVERGKLLPDQRVVITDNRIEAMGGGPRRAHGGRRRHPGAPAPLGPPLARGRRLGSARRSRNDWPKAVETLRRSVLSGLPYVDGKPITVPITEGRAA